MSLRALLLGLVIVSEVSGISRKAFPETCTTQSQMNAQDRNSLAAAARDVAAKVQAADFSGIRSETVAEFASNFGAMQNLVQQTGPHLAGGALTLDQLYLLDASQLKVAGDAQFFCSLNQSAAEVGFMIPGLTPGVYGFAVVQVASSTPWVVPMLLRKDQGRWLLVFL